MLAVLCGKSPWKFGEEKEGEEEVKEEGEEGEDRKGDEEEESHR